ncbi:helix-turn-helix domain-containing protein [Rubellimicrobium aerolatum]|uniref:helix-turn-helix domain-containing protein n=1 Tax=Rubellimicrobium aerolatum TaxID=490979 RepID=UPI003CC909B5
MTEEKAHRGKKPSTGARDGSPPPASSLEPLLSLEDTAEVLGCSIRTLRRLIDADELPVVRLGRLVRVHPRDLDRFIAGRRSL